MVKGWVECPITEVLKAGGIKIGPFGSQLKKEMLLSDGLYRVYGQENVYEHDFSLGDRYLTRDHFNRLSSCEILPGEHDGDNRKMRYCTTFNPARDNGLTFNKATFRR